MYKQVKSWQKHLDFILMDFCGLQLSFVLAYWMRWRRWNAYHQEMYRDLAIFASAFFLVVILIDNSYSGILRRKVHQELYAVIRLNLMILIVLLLYLFVVHTTELYSRIQMGVFILINNAVMFVSHLLLKWMIRRRTRESTDAQHLLLVTGEDVVYRRVKQLQETPYTKVKLDGVFVLGEKNENLKPIPIPVLGITREEVLEYVRTHVVDEVMIDVTKDTGGLIDQILDMGVTVHLSIDHLAVNCPNPTVEKVNGIQCISSTIHIITPFEAFLKRTLDIVVGAVGCIVTGIICIFIAPIIKKQAPGPVFFCQNRVGKNGRTFTMYKFRSMYVDAEERKAALMDQNKMTGLMFKMENDPRIYPFGHFLRRTSLDEFPQFWNILKGDMSLVGTRPPTLDEYKQYEFHHKGRLAARPGLLGLWQISGRSEITDFEEVVKLDNEYIQNWTLGLDMEILAKAIKAVLTQKGAA